MRLHVTRPSPARFLGAVWGDATLRAAILGAHAPAMGAVLLAASVLGDEVTQVLFEIGLVLGGLNLETFKIDAVKLS